MRRAKTNHDELSDAELLALFLLALAIVDDLGAIAVIAIVSWLRLATTSSPRAGRARTASMKSAARIMPAPRARC